MASPASIPTPCKTCRKKACQDLYWKDCIVLPEQFAVPFDCPLRIKDESRFRWELQSLRDYDLSCVAGEVWAKHNFAARYGSGRHDDMEHLLCCFRQSQCTMIAKSQNPSYKPWTQFGQWAKSANASIESYGFLFDLKKPWDTDEPARRESVDDAVIADSGPKKPLEIKAAGMEHLDEVLQKDHYRKIAQGDKVKLLAEVDGANEGEGIKFELYYTNEDGTSTHFETVNGTIRNGIGSAEWTANLTKPLKAADTFELKHEPVVRGKYGKACAIGRREPEPSGVPVLVYEYPYAHESKLNANGVPQKLFAELNEHHAAPLLTATRTGPVLVDGKWVYAFARKGNGASLIYECKPGVQNEKQTFEFVSWGQADWESNSKTYPRPLKGEAKDTLALRPDREYYVMVSPVQLHQNRLDYYTQNLDKLAQRSLHIPANTLKQQDYPTDLYLTDYVQIAVGLREEYDKHAQSYEKYTTDYEKAQRRYLAGLVCAVADAKPRFKGWIDYEAVSRERDEDNRENQERQKGKATTEAHLRDWKLSKGFLVAFEDYKGTQETEQEQLELAAYLTTLEEIDYLTQALETDESWLNRVFLNDDAFLFHRKIATLINEPDAQGLLAQFLVGRYLAKYSPVKYKGRLSVGAMVSMQEAYIKEIQPVFDKADTDLFSASLKKRNGNWFFVDTDPDSKMPIITAEFKDQGQIKGRASLNRKAYQEARGKWNAAVGSVLPVLQWTFAGMEAVNLANAGYCLLHWDSIEDLASSTVNAAGSLADFAGSLNFLTEQLLQNREIRRGASKLIAQKSAERFFARVNLIGSVCDYIGAAKEVGDAAERGLTGQAAGQAVIALASAASGAGATLTIMNTTAAITAATGGAAAGTSATFLGLSAGPLGLIGIGLFIAGAGIVWYFSEEELRKWAKRCAWSKNPDSSYLLVHQTYDLHRILCDFEVDCYAISRQKRAVLGTPSPKDFEHSFTVKIIPGYLNEEKSKYRVALSITREGGLFGKDAAVFDKTVEISSKHEQTLHTAQGSQKVLLYRVMLEELGLPVSAIHETHTYTCKAQLDFEGNGVVMFPEEAIDKEGKLERVYNDLKQ